METLELALVLQLMYPVVIAGGLFFSICFLGSVLIESIIGFVASVIWSRDDE